MPDTQHPLAIEARMMRFAVAKLRIRPGIRIGTAIHRVTGDRHLYWRHQRYHTQFDETKVPSRILWLTYRTQQGEGTEAQFHEYFNIETEPDDFHAMLKDANS